MSQPLWKPEKARADQTTLASFSTWMSSRTGKPLSSYEELHRYSVADPGEFWSALWDFAGVVGEKGSPPFLVDESRMPGARFFPGARLNFAENLLRKDGAGTALVFWGEDKVKRRMSWSELSAEVARMAAALREAGVGAGDRVGRHPAQHARGHRQRAWRPPPSARCGRPARPTSACRACSIGFGQIEPKVLIACDGYYYGGKTIDIADKLAQIVAKLPSVGSVIVVPYLGRDAAVVQGLNAGMSHSGRRAQTWGEAVGRARPASSPFTACRSRIPSTCCSRRAPPACPSASCIRPAARSEAPVRAPAAYRRQGRRPPVLLHHARLDDVELAGVGPRAAARRCCSTTARRSIPTATSSGTMPQTEKCTHFGTSAKYIDALKKAELAPAETHDLSSAARHAVDRLAAGAGGLRLRLRGRSSATCISPPSPAAPTSSAASCSAFRPSPCGAARSRGRGSGLPSTWSTTTASRVTRGKGELVCTKPFPVHAGRLLERSRRQEVSTPPTSTASPTSGITATSPSGPSTAASSSTAAPTPRSIPAACASARPRSTARSSSSRCRRASSSARIGTTTCASCCSWS